MQCKAETQRFISSGEGVDSGQKNEKSQENETKKEALPYILLKLVGMCVSV